MREVTSAAEEPRPVFLAPAMVECMWMKRDPAGGDRWGTEEAAAAEETGAVDEKEEEEEGSGAE